MAFTLQVIGKSRGFIQEAVPDVLQMVGLAGKAERLPHELSGGEQQRVAIARAVVNKPAILLADEPTGNLDPATSAGIMQVLELINAGGTTVVMATHDVGIVDSMKRRVIELVGGNIVRDEVEGGYTTSIPVQRPATQSVPVVTGAAAFAAAVAEEAGPVELPSSPRTVVEGTPNRYADLPDYDAHPMTAPLAVPTTTGAIPRFGAPIATAAPLAPATPSAPAAPVEAAPLPSTVHPQTTPTPQPAPTAPHPAAQTSAPAPTAEDPLRHLLTPASRPESVAAPAPQAAPPAAAAQAAPDHDDPLALAVRLGLRRPGAAPESTGSQEVGPTS
ncbi:cell division ATP-binding protein FtsE [Herbiconiux sp. L3-i23]|uniref:cell division ATP-binding protein FtsE n=1 Tax=Herbiconiux sp. L3-i23 TaxID=2905871 RepID=UPI00206858ED|nr:hypothetical protein L3i23_21210 [Herbiconiux sp. L3-i23]